MRERRIFNHNQSIKLILILISFAFTVIQIVSLLKLGSISARTIPTRSFENTKQKLIGELGERVIGMLPSDLAFTLFLPSEKAFARDLRLDPNDSLAGDKVNDTHAILTRVLGFSAVPRPIYEADLARGKETVYDSISGLNLDVSKAANGELLVNGIVSDRVDLRIGENLLVHVMDGVIMDAEFEQSVQPDEAEKED